MRFAVGALRALVALALAVLLPALIALGLLYTPRYYPYTTSPEECCNLTNYESVTIHSRNTAVRLSGWYFPGADELTMQHSELQSVRGLFNPKNKGHCVVVVHGHHAHMAKETSWEKSIMTKAVLPFVAAGFNVITFDHRSHGRSTWWRPVTIGYEEAKEVLAVVDWILDQSHCPSSQNRRVFVWGESMGAAATAFAAARDKNQAKAGERKIAGIILDSAFESMDKVISHFLSGTLLFPQFLGNSVVQLLDFWTCLLGPVCLRDIDVSKAVRDVRVPALLVHGLGDNLIPYSHAESLLAHANNRTACGQPVVTESWVHEGDHVRSYLYHEEYYPLIVNFLERIIDRGNQTLDCADED